MPPVERNKHTSGWEWVEGGGCLCGETLSSRFSLSVSKEGNDPKQRQHAPKELKTTYILKMITHQTYLGIKLTRVKSR